MPEVKIIKVGCGNPAKNWMFHFAQEYDAAVKAASDGAVFVEIGCWLGCSSSHMARLIRDSGKDIRFYCVDTWRGPPGGYDGVMGNALKACDGDMFPSWRVRMVDEGVMDYAIPMQMTSVEAAAQFDDESVDFVMIDGDHSYEGALADIDAWYPKLKRGGVMAGDDATFEGVGRAIKERLEGRYTTRGCVWSHSKE